MKKGNFYIGHIEAGEWLQYTIDVQDPGTYRLRFSVSSETAGGVMHISGVGESGIKTQNIQIPATGGNQNWQAVTLNNIQLTKGVHRLRIYFDKGGFNLSSISFIKN